MFATRYTATGTARVGQRVPLRDAGIGRCRPAHDVAGARDALDPGPGRGNVVLDIVADPTATSP